MPTIEKGRPCSNTYCERNTGGECVGAAYRRRYCPTKKESEALKRKRKAGAI